MKTTASKRQRNAYDIQQGASSISGITHALIEALQECRSECVYPGTDEAVGLIVHQMRSLIGSANQDSEVLDLMLGEMRKEETLPLAQNIVADCRVAFNEGVSPYKTPVIQARVLLLYERTLAHKMDEDHRIWSKAYYSCGAVLDAA